MSAAPNRQPHLLELPRGISDKLSGFRRRVWTIKLTEGVLVAAFALLLSYLFVFASDRLWDTPVGLRVAFLAVNVL